MKSIRRHMALTMGSLATILLLAGGGGIYFSLQQTLTAHFDTILAAKARAVMSACEVDDNELELDSDIQAFAGFGAGAVGEYFEIRSESGRVLAKSPSLGTGHLANPADKAPKGTLPNLTLPGGHPGRAIWETFTPKDAETPEFKNLRILVAGDVTGLRDTLRSIAIVLAVFGIGGLATSLGILHGVLGIGLRPLTQLTKDVQTINFDGSQRRLATAYLPSELAPVAEKLNALLERLETTFARERRFTSHAAHELRTPLAELKVMTELGQRWPEEFTPEHVQGMLEVISELESLLDALAILAKADARPALQRESVDLAQTITECVQRFHATLSARHLSVETAISPGTIFTEPAFWKAILVNVVGNAAHHAPANTTIKIYASESGVKITNEAPQISPADLPQLFERFWQKPSARSPEKHFGLGLSIVKACAELLGGSCSASLEGSLLSVEIRLVPLPPSP